MTRPDPSPEGLRPREHTIERLLPLLEQAEIGWRGLDRLVHAAIVGDGDYYCPHYTTSLDGALKLVEPGHVWMVEGDTPWEATCPPRAAVFLVGGEPYFLYRPTAALALCIAALKARAQLSKSVPSLSQTPARGASTS